MGARTDLVKLFFKYRPLEPLNSSILTTTSEVSYCALRNTDQQNSISGSQNACKSVGIKLPHTLLICSNNPRAKKWLKRALPDPMLKFKLNMQLFVEVICGRQKPPEAAATQCVGFRASRRVSRTDGAASPVIDPLQLKRTVGLVGTYNSYASRREALVGVARGQVHGNIQKVAKFESNS